MNVESEIKSLSVQALQDLLNSLTQAKGFVIEQAPDFCQQLIARGMYMPAYTGCCMILLGLIGFAFAVYGVRTAKKWNDAEPHCEASVALAVSSGMIGLGSVITAGLSVIQFYQALAVYVAPKVYLVEEITRMIK